MAFLDEQSTLTFRGGIVAASLATAVLVMGLVERRPDGMTRANGVTPVRRVMRHPAASWVGASYRSTSGTGPSSSSSARTTGPPGHGPPTC